MHGNTHLGGGSLCSGGFRGVAKGAVAPLPAITENTKIHVLTLKQQQNFCI